MIAKGKPPKDDRWKAKYKEPQPPDTSELPDLPEGWCWATWSRSQLVLVTDVDTDPPCVSDTGIPHVEPKDFTRRDGIDFDGIVHTSSLTLSLHEELARKIRA